MQMICPVRDTCNLMQRDVRPGDPIIPKKDFCTHKVPHGWNHGCEYAHRGCPKCVEMVSPQGQEVTHG